MNYLEFQLKINPRHPWEEIVVQSLADIGFDSFVENEEDVLAYVDSKHFEEANFQQLMDELRAQNVEITYTSKAIEPKNWNAQWETDYPTVTIGKELLIRAPFHKEDPSFKLSIEIQPQMSFGTGHHQTTYLLCEALLKENLQSTTVLDVGTGTGVLGILAGLRGASEIFGTDIEEGAVENAKENCLRNNISNFTIQEGDIEVVPNKQYDVVVANINRNVLIRHLPNYAQLIRKGGVLFLSGFFETDAQKLVECAKKFNFMHEDTFVKETWCVLKFQKR